MVWRIAVLFRTNPRRHVPVAVLAAAAACVLAACSGTGTPSAPAPLPLKQIQDLRLPGGATRLDYQSIDPTARRLYVAHLGDGTVEAVDLDRPAVAGTVTGTASAHGVMVASDRHTLLVAASGTNELVLIDTATLKETGRVKAGDLPDGIAYDPAHGKAYVSNEHDRAVTVVDMAKGAAAAPV